MVDGVAPMQRAVPVDGPLLVADGQPGWRAPASMRRSDVNGPVGPVAHRHPMMDGDVSPGSDLMARRGLVAVIL